VTKKANQTQALIPGLDGLRALAVLLVIFYHLFPQIFPGGYIGVDIFFVISGFLITTLLIYENAKTGKINLRGFWLRRARRLLPALFTIILIICSLMFFIRGDLLVGLERQIIGALTFSSNWIEVLAGTNYFDSTTPHLFLNFWSLAVEEQFYLLWPFVILLLVKGIKKPRFAVAFTLFFALGSAGWMAYLFTTGAGATRVYYGTDTHIFGLMLGACLAFWSYKQHAGQAIRRLSQHFWGLRRLPRVAFFSALISLAGLLTLTFTLSDQNNFTYQGGLFLASILTAVVILTIISTPHILQRALNHSVISWVGVRSYGLYLWHWPLIIIAELIIPSTFKPWLLPLSVLVVTFTAAALSYRFIETPVRLHGFWQVAKRAIKQKHIVVDTSTIHIRRRPHTIAIATLAMIVLTIATVANAPTKTSAQLSIEKGQQVLARQASQTSRASSSPQLHLAPIQHTSIAGGDITAVGDSVMVASTPALEARFPGIYIDAEVSRSLRGGGLDTIAALESTNQLRKVVIVGLGTNGYYGTGKLSELVSQLQGHEIVLVAAHGDRVWTAPNNDDARALAQTNKDVSFAEWDQAITPHPELLAADGIHPDETGGALYANCIQTALKKFE